MFISRETKKYLNVLKPVSPVSLTAPTRDFQSQFKRRILVANWKKFPRQFHWQRGFLALAIASKKTSVKLAQSGRDLAQSVKLGV